jgi:hypothetical protein
MAKLKKETIELLKTPATRQDSIDVLNSQLAQNNYYKKLKKYLVGTEKRKPYAKSEEEKYKLISDNKNEILNSNEIITDPENAYNLYNYKILNSNKNDILKKAFKMLKYAKTEGKDKYHYLDLVSPMLNFDAPLALFNSKIKPKGTIARVYDNIPGNQVTTWEYDPLAVTPVDMLTHEQKMLREKIYGPQSYSTNQEELKTIASKKLENESIEKNSIHPIELKNKKVNVNEPENFLDISEPDGKGTKRMYFDTREELEKFQKENPMLKTGSFSRAKIKPEVLEILKKKK